MDPDVFPDPRAPDTFHSVYCRHYHLLPTLPLLVIEEAIGVLIPMGSPVQVLTELDKLIHALELSAALFLSAFTFNVLHSTPVAALLIYCQTEEEEKSRMLTQNSY